MPVGYFFDVMTNGFGAMPDYRAQIPADDRWRIVAYIRALQLSHHATTATCRPTSSKQLTERRPPRRRRRRAQQRRQQ